jgi:ribosomal RNA-processing protein 8
MSLFEVPGWSVKTAPVPEQSQQVSKKRKRPNSHRDDIQSAEVNIEKLMAKLANKELEGSPPAPKKRKNAQNQYQAAPSTAERRREGKTAQNPDTPSVLPSLKTKKEEKKKQKVDPSPNLPAKAIQLPPKVPTPSNTHLTLLQKSMRDSLDGARFR